MSHRRHREHEPVVFDPATDQWFVFAYDDVRAGLSDPRLTSDRMHRFADRAARSAVEAVRRHAPWIISPAGSDYDWLRPALHAGLRDAVGLRAEAASAGAAHELLDDLLARERFDVVSDYAYAHAGLALADFLGVERAQSDRLMRWAVDIVAFFNDAATTAQRAAAMASSAAEMVAYAHEMLGSVPAETGGGFLGLAARIAQRGGHELGDEAVGNLALPYLTGQVGVAQLVANSVWLLLDHEDQRARLAADPPCWPERWARRCATCRPRHSPRASRSSRSPCAVIASSPGTRFSSALRRPTATRSASPIPTASTSRAGRPAPWASGTARTAASAPGWRGRRPRSRCGRSWSGAPDLARDTEREVVWSPLAGIEGPQALSVRATAAPAARPDR